MNERILLVISVFVGAAISAHAQNIVQNRGFETGSLPPWIISGDTSGSGVGSGNQHSGNYEFYSNTPNSPCSLDQQLPTTVGTAYNVSFWLRNDDSSHDNFFQAVLGNVLLVVLANEGSFGYTQFTFNNVVPGANADLGFLYNNAFSYFYLDDVSVEQVPEPGALGLIAVGALGLVATLPKRLV